MHDHRSRTIMHDHRSPTIMHDHRSPTIMHDHPVILFQERPKAGPQNH